MFRGAGTGVFLGGGTGVFLSEGTGMFLGDGTGVFLGVVDPRAPVDASKKLGVFDPKPGPGSALKESLFLKSSLKYAKSAFNLSMMLSKDD